MKKLMLTLLTAGMGLLSAHAQKNTSFLIMAGTCQELNIADHLKVVLLQAEPGRTATSIDSEAAKRLKLTLSGNTLSVEPQLLKDRNMTVYIMVNDLAELHIGANAEVRTEGILQSKRLQLFLDNNAYAQIRTAGKVNAIPVGDFELIEKRKPIHPSDDRSVLR